MRPRGLARFVGAALLGATTGAAFGVSFGLLASVFRGGPMPWTGAGESAPFFSAAFALAGLVLATERPTQRRP